MSHEIGIIGDVHGNLPALRDIIEKATKRTDKLIFVGDYINRGPQSADVIDLLTGLSDQLRETIFLRGNHETAFMNYLRGGSIADFLLMGGAATLQSYMTPETAHNNPDRDNMVPDSHAVFFERLLDSYWTDKLVVTHSPKDPLPAELVQTNGSVFRVAGHLPQSNLVPRISSDMALIDTGSGMWDDGRLTCLFWPRKDWIQA